MYFTFLQEKMIPYIALSNILLSLLYLTVKVQQYFESSSCMFLDKKTLLKMCLILG